jgi:crotonobetainyl-CoA:carnitine CoA-transferase CaiB-like acyl-CoA transferase
LNLTRDLVAVSVIRRGYPKSDGLVRFICDIKMTTGISHGLIFIVAIKGAKKVKYALENIKVVSLGSSVSAPLCTRLLGDMGAEVIKVERPDGGDFSRSWDDVAGGFSSAHLWCNPNKKSITLNLKKPEGREILLKLAARADVFIENFSPGVVESLGVDYATVKEITPDILYCSISGYGQDGPYRDNRALDALIQGEAGIIDLTGSEEEPAKVALSIADTVAGMYAAYTILAALNFRRETGEGQYLDVSMFDCMVSLLGYFPFRHWYLGENPRRVGLKHHLLAPYGAFKAGDGRYVQFSVATNEAWGKLCRLLDREDLLEEEKYKHNAGRLQARDELNNQIERIMAQHDSAYWLEKLNEAGIPCGRVNELKEVLEHPQTLHRKLVKEVESGIGRLKLLDFPIKMSGMPSRLEPPPALGEHTHQILAALGYGEEDMERLRSEGII